MPATTINDQLKIGYVPLIDSAPLLVAQAEGLFEDEGVAVSLSAEVGWATVRDKLIHQELDLASTLLGLPYAIHNGVGCFQTPMSIPLIMNANGNTITLTSDLSLEDLDSPEILAAKLNERAAPHNRKWTFATVNPYSSHLILLFKWLSQKLQNFIAEIELVFLPPQLFPELLEKGMIDGYCAGEPWGAMAVNSGHGIIVADSIQLAQSHPEKVLAVPQRTMDYREAGVTAVGKALLKALALCDDPDYQGKLTSILANNPSLGLSKQEVTECIQRKGINSQTPLHRFYDKEVNQPTHEKEQWVIKGLKEAGLFRKKIVATGQLMQPDIFF